jgi:hypothetical protein
VGGAGRLADLVAGVVSALVAVDRDGGVAAFFPPAGGAGDGGLARVQRERPGPFGVERPRVAQRLEVPRVERHRLSAGGYRRPSLAQLVTALTGDDDPAEGAQLFDGDPGSGRVGGLELLG